jgi:Ca2+-dependent lipid-binding protein
MAQLQITLIEGRNLKQKDTFSENDAYVTMYLDDKNQKQKSKTKQNSNNPTWNESFVL